MAGRLGKLRQRFGIAAPRVAVRGQIPWYWRWLGIALLLVAAMLLAAWIYDAGGRFAGFDRSEITGQLGETRRSLDAARAGRELVVSLTEGGRSAMMSFPEQADAGASAFRLAFKYFQRVEGTFRVSPKAKVENVQVRVYETGAPQPKATHTVTLR